MYKLLLTCALVVGAFAPSAFAQSDANGAIVAPEGYSVAATETVTFEDFEDGIVYDARGENVGEIVDFVMAASNSQTDQNAGTTMSGNDTTGTTAGTAATTSTDDKGSTGMAVQHTGKISGVASHVVMDIGGFLGMGEHRVAVPVEAMQVYKTADSATVRIYLPWTEEQLKALPSYVEGDMSTLGKMPADN